MDVSQNMLLSLPFQLLLYRALRAADILNVELLEERLIIHDASGRDIVFFQKMPERRSPAEQLNLTAFDWD